MWKADYFMTVAEPTTTAPTFQQLLSWSLKNRTYPMTDPSSGPVEYHRLQIEYWLWTHRDAIELLAYNLAAPVVDVGAEYDHEFVANLLQLNNHEYTTPSGYSLVRPALIGDLLSLPFADASLSCILCMETVEHVQDPFRAAAELYRCLKPGGLLLASTPFFWPEHGGPDYRDYWRITRDGWGVLLSRAGFSPGMCDVQPTRLQDASMLALNVFAQKEVMEIGMVDDMSRYTPGYLVRAFR